MHSFLVAFAYVAMILIPCACAQWGDVLTADWWSMKLQRRESRAFGRAIGYNAYGDPLLASVRAQRAALQIQTLAEAAFVPTDTPAMPVAPQFVQVLLDAQRRKQAQRVAQSPALQRSAARVAERLAMLAEAHRLANSTEVAAPAAKAEPMLVRKPPMRVLVAPTEQLVPAMARAGSTIHLATPSAAQLEALYLLQAESSGEVPVAVEAVETPPISVAA